MAQKTIELDNLTEIQQVHEQIAALENRVAILEIIAKTQTIGVGPEPKKTTTEVIQINADGKRYFCRTEEEQQAFVRNHPNAKTETFKVELSNATADEYLKTPENVAAFREPSNAGRTD